MREVAKDKPKIGGLEIPDLIGIIAAILASTAIFVTWKIAWNQTKISKQQTAIHLHQQYYGIENYLHVIAPTVQVRLKWMFLNEPDREQYRDEVVKGWARFFRDPDGLARYVSDFASADHCKAHFQATNQKQSLTEHQSLTTFLHFWSNLYSMLRQGLVDKKLCRALFTHAYNYNKDFIYQLRERVKSQLAEEDVIPPWIERTSALEKILYKHQRPMGTTSSKQSADEK
jgi:hypothetical protein